MDLPSGTEDRKRASTIVDPRRDVRTQRGAAVYARRALPFTTPVAGAEILKGKAYVKVVDASGTPLMQGQFVDAAGVFVSVDNTNHGVGFGANGAVPGAAGFPGNPVYPYAVLALTPSTPITLMVDADVTGIAASCVNFPAVRYEVDCGVPLHLATTAGDLVVDAALSGKQVGRFVVRTSSPVTFTSFDLASAQLLGTGAGFELRGGFTLGATSDGIDPSTEAVTIQFGTSTIAIPAGSFSKNRRGTYAFEGTVGDVSVDARIAPGGTGSYSLQVEASGADLSGTTDPVTVGLTIGNDTGTTTVAAGSD